MTETIFCKRDLQFKQSTNRSHPILFSLPSFSCVVICCNMLQCVAVCCSVMQCDAMCCNVLQCDAV